MRGDLYLGVNLAIMPAIQIPSSVLVCWKTVGVYAMMMGTLLTLLAGLLFVRIWKGKLNRNGLVAAVVFSIAGLSATHVLVYFVHPAGLDTTIEEYFVSGGLYKAVLALVAALGLRVLCDPSSRTSASSDSLGSDRRNA